MKGKCSLVSYLECAMALLMHSVSQSLNFLTQIFLFLNHHCVRLPMRMHTASLLAKNFGKWTEILVFDETVPLSLSYSVDECCLNKITSQLKTYLFVVRVRGFVN